MNAIFEISSLQIINPNFTIRKTWDKTTIQNILANASLEGRYVPPGVKELAEKKCKVCMRCEIATNHFITILQPKLNKRYFQAMCKYALIVINLLTKSLGAKPLPMLDVVLIDLDLPKRVDLSKIPDCSNVNSGFSYPSHHKVVVYRHEEMLKVLIHELLHVYDFRFTPSNDMIEKRFATKFHIKQMNINEGYVDALAILINTTLYAKVNHLSFSKCWKQEQKHMMQKAKSIITIYKRLVGSEYIVEPTNTMSYYVLKAMMLNDNIYIPIIHKNLSNEDRSQRVDILTQRILSCLKSSSDFFKNISKIRANYDNMRMSLLNVMKGI